MKSKHGMFIKSIVYGGVDGIITTFAVVSSASGAALETKVLLILGFANLIADGISMAFGDYLSSRAHYEVLEQAEKKDVAGRFHYQVLALKSACYTFASFLIFGMVPLLTYVLAPLSDVVADNRFFTTCVFTGLTLFTLGALKTILTKKNWLTSGLEMLCLGGTCALVAYGIGHILADFIK